MDWSKLPYQNKLFSITEILSQIPWDNATFAWFKTILWVEPQPSEKYLDSCYALIQRVIALDHTQHDADAMQLHEKLVQRERALHQKEATEKAETNVDDILQWL